MYKKFLHRRYNKKGQGLVEYTLILVLVSLACYGALQALGGKIDEKIVEVTGKLDG